MGAISVGQTRLNRGKRRSQHPCYVNGLFAVARDPQRRRTYDRRTGGGVVHAAPGLCADLSLNMHDASLFVMNVYDDCVRNV